MMSDDSNTENVDLWSTEKCIFCSGKIEEDSKILNCLHIICEDCVMEKSTDSGIRCKCKMVTKGKLIDYSIMSPNQSKVKVCCEQNCEVIAKKICMFCKSVYCKSCSKTHPINNEDHNPALMMTYPLKKEFVSCPKCMENCVEVFCTRCSKMICSLCHLKFHQSHDFKLLSTMGIETKEEFQSLLDDGSNDNNHLDCLILKSDENIEKLKSEKRKIIEKVDKTINMLHEEVNKRSLEIKNILETNFTNAVNRINKNKEVLNDFKKENIYYHDVTSSVINHNKTFQPILLSKIIKNQMNIARSHTKDMPEGIENSKAQLLYDDEESVKKCVESIQGLGNIGSITPVNLSEFKIACDSKNALCGLENDGSSHLRSASMTGQSCIINVEEVIEEMMDEDSDSSEYEPLLSCSCCNQWCAELICCSDCNRFYHNDCHIPALPMELRPKDPSLLRWKCTLCNEVLILEYNIKHHTDSINSSEKKLIERILMELYCQNNDSEHYRDCLMRECYPQYYETIEDPISLNVIKKRFESNPSYYTSLVDILKDLKRVFLNGKLYYTDTDPYYKSAEELDISLHKMICSWLPTLEAAIL